MRRPVVLVTDCHTKALRRRLDGRLGAVFLKLKHWSLGWSSLLIVSNDGLLAEARVYNRNCLSLTDPVPEMQARKMQQSVAKYAVVVMSYAKDEPIEELLRAAELFSERAVVYLTGNAPPALRQRLSSHQGVRFTGYLPDAEYEELLGGAACVVALTEEADCLQCAGYEALALGVPFVTSDTAVLRQYFAGTAIHVDHCPPAIVAGMELALACNDEYRIKLAHLRERRQREGLVQVRMLRKLVCVGGE